MSSSAPPPPAPSTLERAQALGPQLSDLRRHLHAAPEVGLHLPRTQGALRDALAGLGLELTTGTGCTSVTGVLRGGAPSLAGVPDDQRPTVLLRADMDALPVHEAVDTPYRSRADGVMHACGHDLHMAALVGAARLLAEQAGQLPGDVVLMLQPGEEGYDGASVMIAEGVLEAAGRRPDAAWAAHVFSSTAPRGLVTTRPGPLMASSNQLDVVVHGAGGHGSAPERAADPVPALCEMALGLQARLTRSVSPFEPAVLTVGRIAAGTASNVIPDTAELSATLRCLDDAVLDRLEADLLRYCRGVAAAHGLEADARLTRTYPVTVNDTAAVDVVERAVAGVLGPGRFARLERPIAGSEDFSRVLAAVPGAMVFVGACAEDDPRTAADNHSPRAAFDDAVLPDVAALLVDLAERTLAAVPA
jgi:hippurate hydrolase